MIAFLGAVAGLCFGWWLLQLIFCLGYRRAMVPPPVAREGMAWPKFVVFVPVRGFDETLLGAIRSVLAVDYPNFTVRILFDSREDAAWEPVAAELARLQDSRVTVHVQERHLDTCSLLCSNFVAAIDELEPDMELVAFCAADMIVPKHWLKAMAGAMADPAAGSTLGNRWYVPLTAGAGGMVRWMWNAGAVVMMRWCRIPWSGGMTVRTSELRSGGLKERWARSMVEDVSVASHFASDLDRLRFVPDLIVLDDSGLPLRKAYHFIRRQLLWTRLYSPRWLLVVGNAFAGTVATTAPLVLAMVALRQGALGMVSLSMLVFGLYTVGMAALMPIVTDGVARAIQRPLKPFVGLSMASVLVGIPLTQIVYFAACCSAAVTRSVEWRGIHYRIDGPERVRRLGYRPYTPDRERP